MPDVLKRILIDWRWSHGVRVVARASIAAVPRAIDGERAAPLDEVRERFGEVSLRRSIAIGLRERK